MRKPQVKAMVAAKFHPCFFYIVVKCFFWLSLGNITCLFFSVCWSPKGKQLVIGKSDGSFCNVDQNFQLKKLLPAPTILEAGTMRCKYLTFNDLLSRKYDKSINLLCNKTFFIFNMVP